MDKLTLLIRSQWDRLLAVAAAIAGAVVLIIGWLGVSGTAYPAEQMPYLISAGMGGLFLLGVSSALWLSADLRDEWRKLDRIEQALRVAEWDPEQEAAAAFDVAASEPEPTRRLPAVAAEGAR